MMTIHDVIDARARIATEAISDDEQSHIYEKALWWNVLCAIAQDDCHDPKALAAEAIKTKGIKFGRWFA